MTGLAWEPPVLASVKRTDQGPDWEVKGPASLVEGVTLGLTKR